MAGTRVEPSSRRGILRFACATAPILQVGSALARSRRRLQTATAPTSGQLRALAAPTRWTIATFTAGASLGHARITRSRSASAAGFALLLVGLWVGVAEAPSQVPAFPAPCALGWQPSKLNVEGSSPFARYWKRGFWAPLPTALPTNCSPEVGTSKKVSGPERSRDGQVHPHQDATK